MKHPIVHVEIPTDDAKAAARFYGDVFGWKMQTDDTFNYTMFQPQEGPGGGFIDIGENVKAGDVAVYIGTDDIDATLKTIEGHGGKTVLEKTEIPGLGSFAYFTDPAGNKLALWESHNH